MYICRPFLYAYHARERPEPFNAEIEGERQSPYSLLSLLR
jgi:hypothetical protein